MSSVNEETPEQDATHEEEVRTATSEEVYPQRALTFLIILVFTFLVILLIIGLIGLNGSIEHRTNVGTIILVNLCKFNHFQNL